ncbi:T9SS type B sorting domain-containing protein [Flavivirga aquimarina]|uniref:T9SS type B sorting domain-containing protein n=1 Tax=Flavivirga aquimarina TaxID=2027862 RepID=A0ABT8W7M5_9FLAO|nr:T9SS type B sorting domain-containing protein [Flavivirga aquimarina]MDO5969134.1 T9SS type B sorting domain-containing protein [Flavivirga aquimarina]
MWVNRKYLYSLVFFLLNCIGFSQTTIPDPNFEQALIDLGIDTDGTINSSVLTTDINSELSLDVRGYNIQNLSGIEDFSALRELYCDNNLLTALDVTQNSNLQILWCDSNQITNLDVTQNPNLISLVCGNNMLTSLNVTQNPNLNVLVCENNQISSLNVSQNSTLSRFQCGNNLLTNLDISNNLNVAFLTCENNQLTSLDVSLNAQLANLNCSFNLLTELDISSNSIITQLDCSFNDLCRLNIRNGNNGNMTLVDFSSNLDLNCIVVDNPSGDHSIWQPVSFSNYVVSQNDCNNFVNVDTLNDVITSTSYTLPNLTNGEYFSLSGGNGIPFNSGDAITSSRIIYIYNETACDSNESSFSVLIIDDDYYIPKYFTPNNDGRHDLWQVFDSNNSIKVIHIFNKYGKLLKSLPQNSQGWNGTFNGKLMNTDDYWYVITLNSGEIIRGHFALKR